MARHGSLKISQAGSGIEVLNIRDLRVSFSQLPRELHIIAALLSQLVKIFERPLHHWFAARACHSVEMTPATSVTRMSDRFPKKRLADRWFWRCPIMIHNRQLPRKRTSSPGTLFGERYRIIRTRRDGEVYRASDLKLNQPVALKFLPMAVANKPALHSQRSSHCPPGLCGFA